MDITDRVERLIVEHFPEARVQLVGSRQRGEQSALSDWDFRIDSPDCTGLVAELPSVAASLEPLGALWDPLSSRAVYMVVIPGAVKVDLFPGDEGQAIEPPWSPGRNNLVLIDAHFWDWTLWLGGKALRPGSDELIRGELVKMAGFLLGPLGAPHAPTTISDAVRTYRTCRDESEQRYGLPVPRRIGDEVTDALRRHSLL